MKEDETIRRLKEKWWKTNNIGEEDCSAGEDGNESGMKMENVAGIFLVLFAGCGISIVIGLFEFMWNVKKVSIDERVSIDRISRV